MIVWLRRFLRALFSPSLAMLEARATEYGRVTLAQVDGVGGVEWYCTIRPTRAQAGPRAHRYQWTGQARRIEEAFADALKEAAENPIRIIGEGVKHAPKLGGAEFDPEDT